MAFPNMCNYSGPMKHFLKFSELTLVAARLLPSWTAYILQGGACPSRHCLTTIARSSG